MHILSSLLFTIDAWQRSLSIPNTPQINVINASQLGCVFSVAKKFLINSGGLYKKHANFIIAETIIMEWRKLWVI